MADWEGEECNLLDVWMEIMQLWRSDGLKDCLQTKGSKVEVELDCEFVENYSLVEEIGLGPSIWRVQKLSDGW